MVRVLSFKYLLIFIVCLCSFTICSAENAGKIRIAVSNSAHTHFKNYLNPILNPMSSEKVTQWKVKDCPSYSPLFNHDIGRPAVEILMICEVIRRYKLADSIEFIPMPNNARAIKAVISGMADTMGVANFSDTYKSFDADSLLETLPVLREGEFNVGIFTAPNRKDVLNISTLEEVTELTLITVSHWVKGRESYLPVTLNSPVLVNQFKVIPDMISKKRADFTTHELSKKRFYDDSGKLALVRIDGFKIVAPGVRTFIVNDQHQEYFNALQDFISKNRRDSKSDLIYQAYEQIGWLSNEYSDWLVVN